MAGKMFTGLLLLASFSPICAQPESSADIDTEVDTNYVIRSLVPLPHYVTISPLSGGDNPGSAPALPLESLRHLAVHFERDSLPKDSGPQFIKIVTTISNREGDLHDRVTQYAFTFPRESTPDSDLSTLKKYAAGITPYGFVVRSKIDSVAVRVDSVPAWGVVKIEIVPDEEYAKFAHRLGTKREWYYRAAGSRYEVAVFVGIPKVLYDSRSQDSINYGNASAMLRLYLLSSQTGERYPVNIGIGTFGVNTPIDVSRGGGGFALSVFFDLVQLINPLSAYLSQHVNAGVEATPFFPIGHQARLLINARIGYSP